MTNRPNQTMDDFEADVIRREISGRDGTDAEVEPKRTLPPMKKAVIDALEIRRPEFT